ncbi:acyl-coenzyme A thioesterase PaaI-like protein [Angulomicrobium tetraedrale]|uniref:Acyl-coenzyme A thioesterase PaaI-like protein n=1 Tax=Ancylobacter tetraedralis TaxID=217068 RepID=A0A839ZDN7_9HYPH|nr:acyl-coenzyme A thioesterase PaaI-like protein [Ancylobacter tetraedralis]
MSGTDSAGAGGSMDATQLQAYLVAQFPQAFGPGRPHRVVRVDAAGAGLVLEAGTDHLRPGDTVSGPAMMGLADIAAYAVILSAIGPVPLAVTTSFSINFLRKPPLGLLVADARLMKLGKRLAVCEVGLRAPHGGEGDPFAVTGAEELCAHAVATYSIPA